MEQNRFQPGDRILLVYWPFGQNGEEVYEEGGIRPAMWIKM